MNIFQLSIFQKFTILFTLLLGAYIYSGFSTFYKNLTPPGSLQEIFLYLAQCVAFVNIVELRIVRAHVNLSLVDLVNLDLSLTRFSLLFSRYY